MKMNVIEKELKIKGYSTLLQTLNPQDQGDILKERFGALVKETEEILGLGSKVEGFNTPQVKVSISTTIKLEFEDPEKAI